MVHILTALLLNAVGTVLMKEDILLYYVGLRFLAESKSCLRFQCNRLSDDIF